MDTTTEQTVVKRTATPLELTRLKYASEAYRVHKSIYIDPVTDEQEPGFQTWPVFRDQFLEDWKSNRRIVTEKEADVHFDRIAEESLSELETIGTPDVAALADQAAESYEGQTNDESPEAAMLPETPVASAIAAAIDANPTKAPEMTVKRLGRPPSKKLVIVEPNNAGSETPKRRGRPPGKRLHLLKAVSKAKTKLLKKKAAAKKKGGSTSERAAEIVAWGQSRKWSRKDIIERLMARIDGLGAAYASTLYQKYAK